MGKQPNLISRSTTADKYYYYVLQTLIGSLCFFGFSISMGLFDLRSDSISGYLLTIEFMKVIFLTFAISFLSGILARILSYYMILRPIYDNIIKRSLKSFMDLNSGINGLGISYLIQTFISSVLFAFGLFSILVNKISSNTTMNQFWVIIISYFVIKFSVYLFVKIILKL